MFNVRSLALPLLAGVSMAGASLAHAESGIGLRVGSMGIGVDVDFALAKKLNGRVGYNFFNHDTTLDDTGVHYDTTIKISSLSGLLDWHVADNGFRLTAGVVSSGPKVAAVGTPSSGSYAIGNGTYSAAQVGSVGGELKIGKSVAPYLGIGYGRVAGNKRRVTFLADLGAFHVGDVDVSLTATCGSSLPAAQCTQLQNDVQAEIRELKASANGAGWYPVISLGVGIRF
jgi:hypothetical protein